MLYIFVYIHTVQLVCVGGDCCATTSAVLSKSHSIYSIQAQMYLVLAITPSRCSSCALQLECSLRARVFGPWSSKDVNLEGALPVCAVRSAHSWMLLVASA